jgi:hypothetical protein
VDKRSLAKIEMVDGGGGGIPPPIDDDATTKGERGEVCGGLQSTGEIIRRETLAVDRYLDLTIEAIDHPEPTHDSTLARVCAQTVSRADTPA